MVLQTKNSVITTTSGADLVASRISRLCAVCHERASKYTCPRCLVAYCRLTCFQKHDSECTEAFFRDQVSETLESDSATTDAQRQQMREILARYQAQQGEDEELTEALARSGSLETADEIQRRFRRAVLAGRVDHLIDLWEPPWRRSVVDSSGGLEEDLPALRSLLPRDPSPLLANALINILYSYTVVARLYNGEPSADVIESAQLLFTVCAALNDAKRVFEDPLEALTAAVSATRESGQVDAELALLCLDDVPLILNSKLHCAAALSSARQVYVDAESHLRGQKHGGTRTALIHVKRSERKLFFFQVWLRDAVGATLLRALRSETNQARSVLAEHEDTGAPAAAAAPATPPAPRSKVVIEEL